MRVRFSPAAPRNLSFSRGGRGGLRSRLQPDVDRFDSCAVLQFCGGVIANGKQPALQAGNAGSTPAVSTIYFLPIAGRADRNAPLPAASGDKETAGEVHMEQLPPEVVDRLNMLSAWMTSELARVGVVQDDNDLSPDVEARFQQFVDAWRNGQRSSLRS